MLIGAPQVTGDVLPVWGADHDGELVCRAVTEETHDVRSFHFATDRPCRFVFEPGQFLTLELPIGG